MSTFVTKNLKINIPIVSSNMDTVTEANLAIALARQGGLGIIHRFMTIDDAANEVKKIKRSEGILIEQPYILNPNQTLEDALDFMRNYDVTGILVTDINKKLLGILTSRDILFETNLNKKIENLMTKNLITAPVGTSLEDAKETLHQNKIEKLPLISEKGILQGLITAKDIIRKDEFPNASKDSKGRLMVGASIGIKDDVVERTSAMLNAGADVIVIDIAHGHADSVINTIKLLRREFGNVEIIAGNVATKEATEDLISAGADCIKVGVGGGCFAAGTRVLMSNGFYKNIEEIQPGERVINKDGKPVNVKKSFCTGIKKVWKIRNSIYYENTYVTPDHQFWIGDLNTVSFETLQSRGYVKLLELQSKTIPKLSKYKWKQVSEFKQEALLIPRNIEFEFPETFEIDLQKRCGGNWRTGFKYALDVTLKPSYELGYIFGTFLGDGNSHTAVFNGTHQGSVYWSFGIKENEIADKLAKCIEFIFNKKCSIVIKENEIEVVFYYKPFADFLKSFDKRTNKHLPEEYLINDKPYLNGLLDGLIDSDGYIEDYGRKRISNTSKKIIELFSIICYLINGFFPSAGKKKITIGGLKNANIKNFNQSYVSGIGTNTKKRLTKNYQAIDLLECSESPINTRVYDLEVDCPTHSFIANNNIVHNSVCVTRIVTGSGVPQLQAVLDSSEVSTQMGVPIMADGGIRNSGDIVKAIGAGANTVMLGNLLAGTEESPGTVLMKEGKKFKIYRGSAGYGTALSRKQQKIQNNLTITEYTPEGVESLVPYKGTVLEVINPLLGGLRSGMSYSGARTIEELKLKCKFIKMSGAGFKESNYHDVKLV